MIFNAPDESGELMRVISTIIIIITIIIMIIIIIIGLVAKANTPRTGHDLQNLLNVSVYVVVMMCCAGSVQYTSNPGNMS